MNEAFLLWGFGLFAVAFILFLFEIFLPTGGLLGVLVAGFSIAGVVSFFRASTVWGLSSVAFLLVMTPIAIGFAFRVWPHTPIGKRLILGSLDTDDAEPRPLVPDPMEEIRHALLGAVGVAMTDLRPVGTVRIEGERIEVLAEGGMIEAGQKVRITAVEGNQIKVRAVK